MSNANVNYEYFNNDNNKDKEHVISLYETSQYKELYSNTNNADISSQQHFVKDLTKPFTYHSISNETYHNLNHSHSHSHDESDCNYYPHDKPGLEDDGCFKLYFCGLIGCCLLCMFGCKHF